MTLTRLRSRLLAAFMLSMAGCGLVDPDPVEFADLTADMRVTPSVLGPGDTAHIHITVTNTTPRRAILDVECGPGYQVFSAERSMLGGDCPLAALHGVEIPPHGSLVIEDVLTPTYRTVRRTYTVLPPGEYRVIAGWYVRTEFHAIGDGASLHVLSPPNAHAAIPSSR